MSAAAPSPSTKTAGAVRHTLWLILALVGLVLAFLFFRSFASGQVVFANDGPLGANQAAANRLPEGFSGLWGDLNWVGAWNGSALTTITYVLLWVLKPVGFAKFYTALSLLAVALCSGFFFRQKGFSRAVCVLAALAASLNSDFFSYSCWGLGTLSLCVSAVFLSLGFIERSRSASAFICFPLAGLALGWAVMEGFDNGAIFSLYVAAYVVFHAWVTGTNTKVQLAKGIARVVCVAIFAAFIAAQTLSTLVGTQIKGVVGTETAGQTPAERWTWATQWSLPKVETIRLLIPGLYGYRMDTAEGGNYWGAVGRHPAWDEFFAAAAQGKTVPQPPANGLRYSGAGFYAGVLVILVALWAITQSFRRAGSVYPLPERKFIWFWTVMAMVSLLFSFGRHAPFYQFVYALPYFSTIRNPIKFLHPLSVCLLILFGYGLQGLFQQYVSELSQKAQSISERFKSWRAQASKFERRWLVILLGFLGLSVVAWLLFSASGREFEGYLRKVGYADATQPAAMRSFALGEIAWYLLFLGLAIGWFGLVLIGAFTGRRARWAGILAGLLLVGDLVRANLPWIVYYDYREKYASNPVLEILRQKPFENRVTAASFLVNRDLSYLLDIYGVEWLQHHFQYYNIQSIDIIQMPREPVDYAAYRGFERGIFSPTNIVAQPRLWELTNTRYILGAAGYLDSLNQQLDPAHKRFRIHSAFEFYRDRADGPILVRTNLTGPFAIFEFTGALPRAKLYTNWRAGVSDAQVLQELPSPQFDPAATVLIADAVNPILNLGNTNSQPAVQITSYTPKRVQYQVKTTQLGVLLVNDKYDPHWKVRVNGRPDKVLRCNYLMRGVLLASGEHTVEFSFEPPATALYISLAAIAIGVLLSVALVFFPNPAARLGPPDPGVGPHPAPGPRDPAPRAAPGSKRKPTPPARSPNP